MTESTPQTVTTSYLTSDTLTIGTYFYDSDGKRIKKVTNQETTTFVYSGGKLVAEYQLTNSTPQTATTQYLGTDMLGSPRVVSDQTGVVVSRRDFMPFGEDLTRANYGSDSIRQKFTGYEKDTETGLDFAEARYYNSAAGTFTAVDPLLASGKSADPQTFNRYSYTMNNPLVMTDSSGMQVGTYIGRVYANKDETNFSSVASEGSHIYEGSKYLAGDDGFTYAITSKGFMSIGNTAEMNANGMSNADAFSQTVEAAYANSTFPSKWVPEMLIDPPGYEETSQTWAAKKDIAANDADMREGDQARAFATVMGIMNGLGSLGGSGAPPRISGGTNSIAEGLFAERLFLSENFGKGSTLFGNEKYNASNTPGLFNKGGSRIKIGWSGTSEEGRFFGSRYNSETGLGIGRRPSLFGGGMQFRIGVGRGTGRRSLTHFDLPGTFVPNSRANPYKIK